MNIKIYNQSLGRGRDMLNISLMTIMIKSRPYSAIFGGLNE